MLRTVFNTGKPKGEYTTNYNYLGYGDTVNICIITDDVNEEEKEYIIESNVYDYVREDILEQSHGVITVDNKVIGIEFSADDYERDKFIPMVIYIEGGHKIKKVINTEMLYCAKKYNTYRDYEDFQRKVNLSVKKKRIQNDKTIKIKLNAKLYFIGDEYYIFDMDVIDYGQNTIYQSYKNLEEKLYVEYEKYLDIQKDYIDVYDRYKVDEGQLFMLRSTGDIYMYMGKYHYKKPQTFYTFNQSHLKDTMEYSLLVRYDSFNDELDFTNVELEYWSKLRVKYVISSEGKIEGIDYKMHKDKLLEVINICKEDYKLMLSDGLFSLRSKRLTEDIDKYDERQEVVKQNEFRMKLSKGKNYNYTVTFYTANNIYTYVEPMVGSISLNTLYKLSHISKEDSGEIDGISKEDLLRLNEYLKLVDFKEHYELKLQRVKSDKNWIYYQVYEKKETKHKLTIDDLYFKGYNIDG